MAHQQLNNTALLATGIIMMTLTTSVFVIRMYLGVVKQRRFSWEDGWLIASWVVFTVITSLYLKTGPVIFRLQALAAGEIPPYATILDDSLALQKTFFVTTSGLWICLWLVKASLLSLYKRLLDNVKMFLIAWWVVVAICILSLAGAITSSMLSCSSMKAWFTAGACGTPRDIKAAFISLWYSYAVDVFTDLLVMLLPLGLIRNLQMHWKRKLSIAALFGLGWICIGVSTVRAAVLSRDTQGNFRQPSTAWLALWGIVESSIAVIIGCGPGIYREFTLVSNTRHDYYRNHYPGGTYGEGTGPRSRQTGTETDIKLHSYPQAVTQAMNESSSQEDLVEPVGGNNIRVTRSVIVSTGAMDAKNN